MSDRDFTYTRKLNPHTIRSKEIIKKYPDVRNLVGAYRPSFLIILILTFVQILIANYLKASPFYLVIIFAYLLGSIISHSLFVMIHEASHNLIFDNPKLDKLAGALCNIAQGIPSAAGFRIFHLYHHSHLNEYDYDADLSFYWEAKLVKNIWWRKLIWFFSFMFIEAIRPSKLKSLKLFTPSVMLNIIFILITNVMIYKFTGAYGISYILLSTFFSVGLHPLGARWIQEHYTFNEGQETYSYYGVMNWVNFNIGYHNEHHDFFRVPWINLPKLKKIAPEYYNNLYYHKSWSKLLLEFIFNDNLSLYSRIVRIRESK